MNDIVVIVCVALFIFGCGVEVGSILMKWSIRRVTRVECAGCEVFKSLTMNQ